MSALTPLERAREAASQPWPPANLDRVMSLATYGPCVRCGGSLERRVVEEEPNVFRFGACCVDCGSFR